MIAERPKAPARDSAITVRLSEEERAKLRAYAVKNDLRFSQAIRRWIREELPVAGTERHGASRDGRAA